MYGIVIIAIFLTRLCQKWLGGTKLFEHKPFSCAPCLSFWWSVLLVAGYIVGLYIVSELIINFDLIFNSILTLAATYLAAEILIIYESK